MVLVSFVCAVFNFILLDILPGTSAGDPREAKAIGAVFNEPGRTEPLRLGSVKSNIGHLEGAAGLAAVIKMVESIGNEAVAPNMWFKSPNPQIPFDKWKLKVLTQPEQWPRTDRCRRASINSFGYVSINLRVGCIGADFFW